MSDPMSNRSLEIDDGQLLSDLFGIERDFGSVVQFCERLSSAYDADPVDFQLLDALSTACVVRYCRCFEVGVRAKIARESIVAVDPRFVEFHDYLFSLRQKHLSHSVNEFEDNRVTVVVAEPPAKPSVLEISVGGGRVAGLDKKTAENLKVLAAKLRESVATEIASEKARLLARIAALPIEEVYRFPAVPAFQPVWKRAGVKRRRRDA